MNSIEEGWNQNRDEYLEKTYAAVRSNPDKSPLNEVVDKWDFLSEEASKHYLWRALEVFHEIGALETSKEAGQSFLDLEVVEEEELESIEIDRDRELQEYDRVAFNAGEDKRIQNREYEGKKFTKIPSEVAEEHFERHGYQMFDHQADDFQGVVASDETKDKTKQTWFGVFNDLEDNEDAVWMIQIFKASEGPDEELFEEIFSRQNRESYGETRWDREVQKIRQRCNYIWDAAVEAVEEKLPEKVETYQEKYGGDMNEIEALEREFRLMTGEEDLDNGEYINEIAEGYYNNDIRDLELLRPYSEKVEASRADEGDMPIGKAVRDSETSEKRRKRNQIYLKQYLRWVNELAEAKYGG